MKGIALCPTPLTLCLVLLCRSAPGHEAASQGLNGRQLSAWSGKPVVFFAIGHAYGAPENAHSIYPASSLMANVERINAAKPDFVALLGDIVRRSEPEQFRMLRRGLLDRIRAPVFNAVGNHDMTDRAAYESAFGRTYRSFRRGPARFVFLDTLLNRYHIVGEQKNMLDRAIDEVGRDPDLATLCIFMHHPIYFPGDPHFARVWALCNGKNHPPESNFRADFLPQLVRLAESKQVLLIADDVGVSWSFPLMYEKRGERFHCIATGLGDMDRDCIVKFVLDGPRVSVEPISLAGRPLPPLTQYTAESVAKQFAIAPATGAKRHKFRHWKRFALGFVAASASWLLAAIGFACWWRKQHHTAPPPLPPT